MNAKTNRAVAAAAAAAIALSSVSFAPAMAAPVSNKKPTIVASDNTDFSSRRRHRHWRGGNRAALGAFLGIAGTIATLAARDRYYRDYGYYGYAPYRAYGYAPYYGAPVPYGYGPY